ncbi:hypothetical protein [Isoptericola croceus]|uniref:hypothetical protein n=1 Tax=Isoptericola croceus TaxID=3031406 RepID=UPI0023F95D12|nr:hypothetical protein [Isoptericola croceus]
MSGADAVEALTLPSLATFSVCLLPRRMWLVLRLARGCALLVLFVLGWTGQRTSHRPEYRPLRRRGGLGLAVPGTAWRLGVR